MPAFADSQAAMIQAMIDSSKVVAQKMGTVVSRESGTARAIVSFDGSSGLAQPVKCFETVVVDVGDRVGMMRVEGEWIVFGNYTPRLWGNGRMNIQLSSASTTTSSSFSDMPTSPTVSLTKYRDITQFDIDLSVSMRCTTSTPVTVEVAALITWPDLTTVDQVLYRRVYNTTDAHQDITGGIRTALTLPGGAYTVTGRWRRVSGSGTPTIDQNDSITLSVREVLP